MNWYSSCSIIISLSQGQNLWSRLDMQATFIFGSYEYTYTIRAEGERLETFNTRNWKITNHMKKKCLPSNAFTDKYTLVLYNWCLLLFTKRSQVILFSYGNSIKQTVDSNIISFRFIWGWVSNLRADAVEET